MDVKAFWRDVLSQNREALQAYFCKDAVIRWHCTNEKFSVQEYIKVNCDYPGEWDGEIERIENPVKHLSQLYAFSQKTRARHSMLSVLLKSKMS